MGADDEYERGPDIGRIAGFKDPVTFRDFRVLMEKRHLDLEDLVPQFRGELEDGCRDILTRILKGQKLHQDVVIPYRCLLRFYFQELNGYKKLQEARIEAMRPLKSLGNSQQETPRKG